MRSTIPALQTIKSHSPDRGAQSAQFVALGEAMIRDMPADHEQLERTRQVWLSVAGSELTVAVMLSRLGVGASFITCVPDNPYGRLLRNVAREQGVQVEHFVWADRGEPIGRFLYELGRTPRPSAVWYQRKFSAASRLAASMVDWEAALKDARLFHTSGVTLALSAHSGYDHNYMLEAFETAAAAKPSDCLIGLDFNYRSTLWSVDQCKQVMTPLIKNHVDILITTIEDMSKVYGLDCGVARAEEIDKGDFGTLVTDDIHAFLSRLIDMFELKVAAVTIRYPDTHEQHRWESAALDHSGHFYRSPAVRPIVLSDRLGGGDTWAGGFYCGLLTETDIGVAIEKGIRYGDAASRLKQTLMYDLPIITRQEIEERIRADVQGGDRRVTR